MLIWICWPPIELSIMLLQLIAVPPEVLLACYSAGSVIQLCFAIYFWPVTPNPPPPRKRRSRLFRSLTRWFNYYGHALLLHVEHAAHALRTRHNSCPTRNSRRYSHPRSTRIIRGATRTLTQTQFITNVFTEFERACGYRVRLQATNPNIVPWIALAATNNYKQPTMKYDSDSFLIGIDNCSSYSMTNDKTDFTDKPQKVNQAVRGVKGKTQVSLRGTVKWSWNDDEGNLHTEILPNVYYCESLPFRILSPQHWAQTRKRKGRGRAHADTDDTQTILYWQDADARLYTKSIPLDTSANVSIFRSAPGFTKYANFCETCKEDDDELYALRACFAMPREPNATDEPHLIPTDDDPEQATVHAKDQPVNLGQAPSGTEGGSSSKLRPDPIEIDFHDEEIPQQNWAPSEPELSNNPKAQLLHWHYRLGHISFAKIRSMASRGDLPKALSTCDIPKCPGCLYGKAVKRPWKTATAYGQI